MQLVVTFDGFDDWGHRTSHYAAGIVFEGPIVKQVLAEVRRYCVMLKMQWDVDVVAWRVSSPLEIEMAALMEGCDDGE